LSGSYQRACRDGYLEKSGKKIKAGDNNPHSYFRYFRRVIKIDPVKMMTPAPYKYNVFKDT